MGPPRGLASGFLPVCGLLVAVRGPENPGIVSKKLTSRYESGACRSWLKKNPDYLRCSR
jgi:hypothetical protein